tara:strand:- start:372 stop:977 length:606 start_codon:yes stop_codon:yes gene_type:complete
MKKNISRKNWIQNQHKDQYFKKSQILGYRSRSAFKLIELNKKFKIIKKNSSLLDIGSSPGGWSQVTAELIKEGKILAIDKKPMDIVKNVTFLNEDFLEQETKDKITAFFGGKIDVVISDMAANTTGNKSTDCIRTNYLSMEVLSFALKILKSNGSLISKVFMGDDFISVKNFAKKNFKIVKFFKPNSSKSDSKETYIQCTI